VLGALLGDADVKGGHIVSSYVAVDKEVHPESVELKNPISLRVGRIEMSCPSHTYDRTMLLISPCPGNLLPNGGEKWYGSDPKYVNSPHVV